MTQTQAYKYAGLFKILSDDKVLLVIDFLREESDKRHLEKIAKAAKVSVERARSICEKLEREYIIDETDIDGEKYYKFMDSSVANDVDYIIERLV
ncbi:MAG: hypothetical protein Fur003_3440 [Candidatus Dojkabacteria bacterium]